MNITIDDGILIEGMNLIISAADRTVQAGPENVTQAELAPRTGKDDVGKFRSSGISLKEQHTDKHGKTWDKLVASAEVREYGELELAAVRVTCKVEWGELADEAAVRIEFDGIPGLKNLVALHMFSDWWSRPHFDTDLSKLPNRTQLLLWQTDGGRYGCVAPLVSGGYKCDLNSRTGKPGADLTSHDSGLNSCEAAAFIAGSGDDPFELIRRCVHAGMIASGRPGKLRQEKPYPELFEYIGWCTWDALYQNQNEKDILTKLRAFKKARFPMRFLLIDDGWSPTENGQLTGFDIDRKKFPRGLAPLIAEAREKYGIWWTGVWHTYTGYWGGVLEGSEAFNESTESLFRNKRGGHIPYPDLQKGVGFWHRWHSWMREQGVSFVKVDNQGALRHHTKHSLPIGKAAKGAQYALQASVDLNLSGWIINCMCQTSECAWNWISSNVSRNSDDFWPGGHHTAPEHARQNCYNNLLYSCFCWPDWDMWWSDHPRAKYHAALRAISGGPVYVSDAITSSDFDVLWPLVSSDGRLLRCDEPALPTRDCLFANPKDRPVPIKMWNTTGDAGMLAAFNATEGEKKVKGEFRPSDIEGLDGERFAVREFFSGETRVLKPHQAWKFTLEPYGQMLFTVAPIDDGAAIIGLANKYVSPAAVQAEYRSENEITVELREGGDFLAYLDRPPSSVLVNGTKASYAYGDGWLSVKCKSAEMAVVQIRL